MQNKKKKNILFRLWTFITFYISLCSFIYFKIVSSVIYILQFVSWCILKYPKLFCMIIINLLLKIKYIKYPHLLKDDIQAYFLRKPKIYRLYRDFVKSRARYKYRYNRRLKQKLKDSEGLKVVYNSYQTNLTLYIKILKEIRDTLLYFNLLTISLIRKHFRLGWANLNYLFLSLPYAIYLYLVVLPLTFLTTLVYPFIFILSELKRGKPILLVIFNFNLICMRLTMFFILTVLRNFYDLCGFLSFDVVHSSFTYLIGYIAYPLIPLALIPLFIYVMLCAVLHDLSFHAFWEGFERVIGVPTARRLSRSIMDLMEVDLKTTFYLFILPVIYYRLLNQLPVYGEIGYYLWSDSINSSSSLGLIKLSTIPDVTIVERVVHYINYLWILISRVVWDLLLYI